MSQEPGTQRAARLERAIAHALDLLRQGRSDEARRELERAAGAAEPAGLDLAEEISDGELDRAFEDAEPVADEVVDADRVAQEAIRTVDAGGEESVPGISGTFSTSTMAELLERQGDRSGAARIRGQLASSKPPARRERREVVETLERWLANLRRGAPR